jgi:dipeptidase
MCDTLCVLGGDRTIFAKNSDRPVHEAQVVEAFGARASGGTLRTQYVDVPDDGAMPVLGSRPAWLWGFEHGVNARRVAIGNERIWTVDDPRAQPPALIGMDLVRLALERGASAGDAIDVITAALEQHGQGGSGEEEHDEPYFSSFLVADPHAAWVLETSARTWAARPVEHGASISNRVTLRDDWTRSSGDVERGADFDRWRDPSQSTGHADLRLAATGTCVATRARALDARDVVAT